MTVDVWYRDYGIWMVWDRWYQDICEIKVKETKTGIFIQVRAPYLTGIRLICIGKINNPRRVIYNSPKDQANNSLESRVKLRVHQVVSELSLVVESLQFSNLHLSPYDLTLRSLIQFLLKRNREKGRKAIYSSTDLIAAVQRVFAKAL
uniref:Uncharacterized protein n=1 Tax=Oryza sativa subsp. japonica TaxID=39947 RepID=Q33AM2_ORYSJ|nr:hypothetical protein LOC_Os10g09270 [Oryza sativa Japonica Group]